MDEKKRAYRRYCIHDRKWAQKHLLVYKPATFLIDPTAEVEIKTQFSFNDSWSEARRRLNKYPGVLQISKNAHVEVDDFTCYAGSRIEVSPGATLRLKSGFMNYQAVIECFQRIEIGEMCFLAERSILRDSNSHVLERDGFVVTAPIVLEDHVWVGMGAMILPSVTVGEGSVIAAGAVVNRDVPPHSLVAGVPAKVVRTGVTWRGRP